MENTIVHWGYIGIMEKTWKLYYNGHIARMRDLHAQTPAFLNSVRLRGRAEQCSTLENSAGKGSHPACV